MSSVAGWKRGEIWNYFNISVSNEKKAICNECQDSAARGELKIVHLTPKIYESTWETITLTS